MHCPRCREAFETIHEGLFEDILVHRCVGCSVLWLRAESLDRLDDNVQILASQLEWREADDNDGLACPECIGTYRTAGPLLLEVTLPDPPKIVAHRCTSCRSFLLAPGVLEQIRSHVVGLPRGIGGP